MSIPTTDLKNESEALTKESDKQVTGYEMKTGKKAVMFEKLWWASLIMMMIMGAVAVFYRITEGLASTHLTSLMPWGAWVAFYIFFVGLSAGSFLLSTLIVVFGMDRFEVVGRAALFTAIISMAVAMSFVLLDLGRMDRFWHAMTYWNLVSVLSWEVHFYVLYIALLIAELYLMMRTDLIRLAQTSIGWKKSLYEFLTLGSRDLSETSRQNDHRWMRILGFIGIPLAIFGVHGGTGTLFAVVKARVYWHSGLFPVIFVLSALVSGTALLTFIYVIQKKVRGLKVNLDVVKALSQLMALFLIIDLSLEFYEWLVSAYGMEHEHMAVLATLFAGKHAWSFWGLQMFLGAMLPLYLIFSKKTRESIWALAIASLSVVIGIIGVRFNIVVPALIVPVIEGLPRGDYFPSWVEWLSSIGVIAMGMAMYTIGAKFLPLDEENEVLNHE